MIFLKVFKLSGKETKNPNIYPYNILKNKSHNIFIFDKITVLYGSNGCGKSTILNIIAHKLNIKGKERDRAPYPVNPNEPFSFETFVKDCRVSLGEDEFGRIIYAIPSNSRYFKSEEILYEVRKIQQEAVLRESMQVAQIPLKRIEDIEFSQEKFSNGETTMMFLEDRLQPDALYLLDEPEVSLSPQNQVKLAQIINHGARLLNNQFIISTHSPFMLGMLNAKIYDLDTADYEVRKWTELENVRYFYDFFNAKKSEFND